MLRCRNQPLLSSLGQLLFQQTAGGIEQGIDRNRTGAGDVSNCRPVPNWRSDRSNNKRREMRRMCDNVLGEKEWTLVMWRLCRKPRGAAVSSQ